MSTPKVYLAIIEISYEGVVRAHVFKTLEAAKKFKDGPDGRRFGHLAVYEVEPSDEVGTECCTDLLTPVYQE